MNPMYFSMISMLVLAISACVVAHILIGKLRASQLARSGDAGWTGSRKLMLAVLTILSGLIGLAILSAAFPIVAGELPSTLHSGLAMSLSGLMLVGGLLMSSNMRDNLRDRNRVPRPMSSLHSAAQ